MQTNGQALVRNELKAIMLTLNEASKVNDMRRSGEPLSEEFTEKVLSGSSRLNLIAKILLASAMLLGCIILQYSCILNADAHHDATIPTLRR